MRRQAYIGLIEDETDPDTRKAVARIVQKYSTASIERNTTTGRFEVTVDCEEWERKRVKP